MAGFFQEIESERGSARNWVTVAASEIAIDQMLGYRVTRRASVTDVFPPLTRWQVLLGTVADVLLKY